jgi:hypothetical protein
VKLAPYIFNHPIMLLFEILGMYILHSIMVLAANKQ